MRRSDHPNVNRTAFDQHERDTARYVWGMAPPGPDRRAPHGVYRPILRARRGELTALHHLEPTAVIAPVLEPVTDVSGGLGAVLRLVRELPPRTATLSVDVSGFPDSDDQWRSPTLDLAEVFDGYVPVIRAFDSARRLSEHGLAARMHSGRAILRVRPHSDLLNPAEASAACIRIWRGSGLEPEQIDLIIDLADLRCAARAARFEERALRILRWTDQQPWRSTTLAAGSMPANLDDLPTDEAVAVERFDAEFWRKVATPGLGYGDYGVTCPSRRYGTYHRQLPTLRYATEHVWWIHRWSRRGTRSDDRCRELCRSVLDSPHWPAAGARFCWGDAEIARRARHSPGAGTPASWMAWSTSHHLAQVIRELQRPGTRGTTQ